MHITTHVILISAQAIPNLTPLLDERFRPKRVVMLVSPDMRQRADDLETVVKPLGIKTFRHALEDAWDIEHIRDRVIDLMAEYDDEGIALNATGGTKPMSIAAYEMFREFEKPIFYVHPEKDRLIWMYPRGEADADLQDRIKLPQYLQAYGAVLTRQGSNLGVAANLRELSGELTDKIAYYADALKTLNYYAAQADNPSLISPQLNPNQDRALEDLLHLFQQRQLLSLDRDRQLLFRDEAARFYANGGWLEEHVYGVCLGIKKPLCIQDIGRGLEVERQRKGAPVRNELDVAFLKENRLHIIECKTATFTGMPAKKVKGTDVLYKLDALTDLLGGLQARAMLVSYHPLPEADLQRAKDLRIAVCSANDLPRLQEKIANWINGRS